MKIVVRALAIGLLIATPAFAGDACNQVQSCDPGQVCGQCGCGSCCNKTCKIVCEMKEVKKVVWEVQCKEVCTMLPGCDRDCCDDNSCGACPSCDKGCAKNCDPCASLQKHLVPPKCGRVRCVKELVKKEITCKVPVYKCVVTCCGQCGGDCKGAPAESKPAESQPTKAAEQPQAPLPTAPAPQPEKSARLLPPAPARTVSFSR